MKKLFQTIALFFLAFSSTISIAETAACECVQAFNGDRFFASAPAGWRYDNKTMESRGILMLFYPSNNPHDGQLKGSSVYMYVLPTAKVLAKVEKPEEIPTVKGMIQRRMEQIEKAGYRGSAIIQPDSLQPAGNTNHKVTFVEYEVPEASLFENVAYIEDDRTIWALILAAGSKELLQSNVPSLWHVIMNYRVQTKE